MRKPGACSWGVLTLRTSFSPFEKYKYWTRIFLVYDNSKVSSPLPQEAIAGVSKLQPVAVVCFGKTCQHHWSRLALWASETKPGILLWLTFSLCSQCRSAVPVPVPCCCPGPRLVPTYTLGILLLVTTSHRAEESQSAPVEMARLSWEKRRAPGSQFPAL